MEHDLIPFALMLVPIVGCIALFSFLAVASWSNARRREREAYYTSETMKKIAETSGEGAKSAMELLREQERNALRRQSESQRLGGIITVAIGAGAMIFLKALNLEQPIYLSGVIPLLAGLSILIYSYILAPKQ